MSNPGFGRLNPQLFSGRRSDILSDLHQLPSQVKAQMDKMTSVIWRPTPTRIPIAAGQTIQLQSTPTQQSCCTVFADQSNSATITIGPRELAVAANSLPNIAQFQLDAGRNATIYTDNVYSEFYFLSDFWAAHADPAATLYLYVTAWNAKLIQG